MSWDAKAGGRKYYYRSVRIDGEPRKIYVGHGARGQQAALQDHTRRVDRVASRNHWRRKLADISDVSEATVQLACTAQLLFRVVMVCQGYYRHRGSSWRKRRSNHA